MILNALMVFLNFLNLFDKMFKYYRKMIRSYASHHITNQQAELYVWHLRVLPIVFNFPVNAAAAAVPNQCGTCKLWFFLFLVSLLNYSLFELFAWRFCLQGILFFFWPLPFFIFSNFFQKFHKKMLDLAGPWQMRDSLKGKRERQRE